MFIQINKHNSSCFKESFGSIFLIILFFQSELSEISLVTQPLNFGRESSSWINSFKTFLEDMGKCPVFHRLERIDKTKNFNKKNCIWVAR